MAETYNGYCVKCKEKRDFDGEATDSNGRRMAKGICPVCGTKMNRLLGKPDPPPGRSAPGHQGAGSPG